MIPAGSQPSRVGSPDGRPVVTSRNGFGKGWFFGPMKTKLCADFLEGQCVEFQKLRCYVHAMYSMSARSIFKENMSSGFGTMASIFKRVVYLSLQLEPLKRPLVVDSGYRIRIIPAPSIGIATSYNRFLALWARWALYREAAVVAAVTAALPMAQGNSAALWAFRPALGPGSWWRTDRMTQRNQRTHTHKGIHKNPPKDRK